MPDFYTTTRAHRGAKPGVSLLVSSGTRRRIQGDWVPLEACRTPSAQTEGPGPEFYNTTRAPRGAKPGVSPLVSSGTCGVSRGTGSPWKCAEPLRHTQRDMCLIFIPRPAPTGARNRGYRRWFRQKPGGVSRGYWIPPGSVPNSFGTLRWGRSQVLLPRLYFRARFFLFIQQASFLMSSRIRMCCPPGQLNRLQTNESVLN